MLALIPGARFRYTFSRAEPVTTTLHRPSPSSKTSFKNVFYRE